VILSKPKEGTVHSIGQGTVCIVGDKDVPHRSSGVTQAKLFIVN